MKGQQLHSLSIISSSSSSSVSSQKTCLVLISLRTPEAARSFVDDLHGRPYTTLEKDVIASVYPVCRLERHDHIANTVQHYTAATGTEGISLMSPFSEMLFEGNANNGTLAAAVAATSATVAGHRKQSISNDDAEIDHSQLHPHRHLTSSPS